ncbi:c-type cytochrome [Roseixanthobacter glucoisosaccharinicivorans]|uniref:c-type cytochrome n=1 Tax=Roseixanthobacter glucoisosaccharinicivorans TaxID=3119923 RepID=UPI00372BCE08
MFKMSGRAAVALLLLTATAQAGDPPTAFNQCKACHKVEAGRNAIGPSLFGIVGMKAGSVAGYQYSPAMKNSGLTWDDATLTKYLASPKDTVPGTKMAFVGLKKPEEVAAVIAYLKTLR